MNLGITAKLFQMTILLVSVSSVVMSLVYYYGARDLLFENQLKELEQVASQYASRYDNTISELKNDIVILSKLSSIKADLENTSKLKSGLSGYGELLPGQLEEIFTQYVKIKKDYLGIVVYDTNGNKLVDINQGELFYQANKKIDLNIDSINKNIKIDNNADSQVIISMVGLISANSTEDMPVVKAIAPISNNGNKILGTIVIVKDISINEIMKPESAKSIYLQKGNDIIIYPDAIEMTEDESIDVSELQELEGLINNIYIINYKNTELEMIDYSDDNSFVHIHPKLISNGHEDQILWFVAESKRSSIINSLNYLLLKSIILGVILLCVGGLFAITVATYIAKPIRLLTHIVRNYNSEESDNSFDQYIKENNEIGEMARAYKEMVMLVKERDDSLKVTNKKLIEINNQLKEAHDQLLQSEKMASIGQLAAGVAHEINNPVGYVNSNICALENYSKDIIKLIDEMESHEIELPEKSQININQVKNAIDYEYLKDDITNLIKESQEGLDRVKKIVQDLKTLSHSDKADWAEANIHEGLDSTLNIVNNEIKYKAEVIKKYGDLPLVECIPSQLNQVFMNILVNAAHAIESKGVITIATEVIDDYICVSINDNGTGMDDITKRKIFDPFYTTKPVGKGTGLGMSLSYGIINKHKGRIELESELGVGTTFKIILPIHQLEDSAKQNISD